jgi:hypothetical protein
MNYKLFHIQILGIVVDEILVDGSQFRRIF